MQIIFLPGIVSKDIKASKFVEHGSGVVNYLFK